MLLLMYWRGPTQHSIYTEAKAKIHNRQGLYKKDPIYGEPIHTNPSDLTVMCSCSLFGRYRGIPSELRCELRAWRHFVIIGVWL